MKKYIISILFATVIGFGFGKFMITQYQNPSNIIPVMLNSYKAFFLELGIYDTEAQMNENTINFPYYIYMIKDDKYYVYISITGNENNLNKLKGYYEEKGYIINVREYEIDNEAFLTILNQYDNLLLQSNDNSIIDSISSQILNKYEEVVLNDV